VSKRDTALGETCDQKRIDLRGEEGLKDLIQRFSGPLKARLSKTGRIYLFDQPKTCQDVCNVVEPSNFAGRVLL